MSPSATAVAAPAFTARRPSRALRTYGWSVLAYNILVILWGTAVRATNSGMGCGDHWPSCGGSPGLARFIEHTHRATAGIALIAVLILMVWAFIETPKRHMARIASIVSFLLIVNEAVLGGLLVLLGMTAETQSPTRAFFLSLHLTNTLLLLGAMTLTAHFLSRKRGALRGAVEIRRWGLALAAVCSVLITAVFGSLAADADSVHHAANLRQALAMDWSAHSGWLIRIRWAHPAVAILAAVLIVLLIRAALRCSATRWLAAGLGGLLVLQFLLGIGDLTLLTPLTLQILHLLGADLVWVALVVLAARMVLPPASNASNDHL